MHSFNYIYAFSSFMLRFRIDLNGFQLFSFVPLNQSLFPKRNHCLFLGLDFESSMFMVSLFLSESKASLLRIRVEFKNTQRALDVQDFWTEYLFNFRARTVLSKTDSLTSLLRPQMNQKGHCLPIICSRKISALVKDRTVIFLQDEREANETELHKVHENNASNSDLY